MTAIAPSETILEGRWITVGDNVRADDVALRIERLTQSQLKFVASREEGWTKLYRDPTDGRFWELSYPLSHMHGGGAPRLEALSLAVVKSRYGTVAEVEPRAPR